MYEGVWAHGDYCLINPDTGGIWMLGRRWDLPLLVVICSADLLLSRECLLSVNNKCCLMFVITVSISRIALICILRFIVFGDLHGLLCADVPLINSRSLAHNCQQGGYVRADTPPCWQPLEAIPASWACTSPCSYTSLLGLYQPLGYNIATRELYQPPGGAISAPGGYISPLVLETTWARGCPINCHPS